MLNKIRDFYDYAEDTMPTILAVFATILFIAFALGLILGVYCFLGWILMLVWGAIAAAFGLPVFGFWVYVGIIALITFLRGGIKFSVKKAS